MNPTHRWIDWAKPTVQVHPPVVEQWPAVILAWYLSPTKRYETRVLTLEPSSWGWERRWFPRPSEAIARSYAIGPFFLMCVLREPRWSGPRRGPREETG
jgi:hypothetical protein